MQKIKKLKEFVLYLSVMLFFYGSNVFAQSPDSDDVLLNEASGNEVKNIGDFFKRLTDLMNNSVRGTLIALGFLYFTWGVVQYVINPEDEGKKEKGKQHMIWGLIGLTVLFAVLGLIKILANSFNLPEVQTSSSSN